MYRERKRLGDKYYRASVTNLMDYDEIAVFSLNTAEVAYFRDTGEG